MISPKSAMADIHSIIAPTHLKAGWERSRKCRQLHLHAHHKCKEERQRGGVQLSARLSTTRYLPAFHIGKKVKWTSEYALWV
jgi:hypothetical protein